MALSSSRSGRCPRPPGSGRLGEGQRGKTGFSHLCLFLHSRPGPAAGVNSALPPEPQVLRQPHAPHISSWAPSHTPLPAGCHLLRSSHYPPNLPSPCPPCPDHIWVPLPPQNSIIIFFRTSIEDHSWASFSATSYRKPSLDPPAPWIHHTSDLFPMSCLLGSSLIATTWL